MTDIFKFETGAEVKDSLTGFIGIIVARTDWLNGCRRYVVQSKKRTAEGKEISDTIDEQQLSLTHPPKPAKKLKKPPGGPSPRPKQMAGPKRF